MVTSLPRPPPSLRSRYLQGCPQFLSIRTGRRLQQSHHDPLEVAGERRLQGLQQVLPGVPVAEGQREGEAPGVRGGLGMFGWFLSQACSTPPPPFNQGAGAGLLQVYPKSSRDFSGQGTAPGKPWGSHLLGALLERLRDELPLLPAPIGQHVHDGGAVHP